MARPLALLLMLAVMSCNAGTCGKKSSSETRSTKLSSTDPRGARPPKEPSTPPAPPKALSDLTNIAAGDYRTCAIAKDGAAVCWGSNDGGRLGFVSTTKCGYDTCALLPAKVPFLTDAAQIALFPGGGGSNTNDTCVRTVSGKAVCWARTISGSGERTPERVLATDVVDVAVGSQHACAAKKDGSVVCWGWGDHALGYEPKTKCTVHTGESRYEVPCSADAHAATGVTGAVQVSLGQAHSCALSTDGKVLCWGRNERGQLGDGTQVSRGEARPIIGVEGVVEVRAGTDHTCARKTDGSVWCWGAGDYNKLGAPAPSCESPITKGYPVPCLTSPRVVPGVADAVEIRVGPRYACARRRDGEILCWGDNRDAKLGGLPRTENLGPTALPPVAGVVEMSIGAEHVCLRKSDGTAKCFGSNKHGELGDGTEVSHALPSDVLVSARTPARLSDAVEVRASGNQTCARTTNGAILCWGAHDGISRQVPTEIANLPNVAELAIGDEHYCARLADGTVSCWGSTDAGQLGVSSRTRRDVPAPMAGVSGVTQLSAAWNHTCARTSAGKVVCWGLNTSPAPGRIEKKNEYGPFEIEGVDDVAEIATGPVHDCARQTNGHVLCWGSNGGGQIGSTPSYDPKPPTPIEIHDAVAIAVSDAHSCAVSKNGRVHCWGMNTKGQLGRDTPNAEKCSTGVNEKCVPKPIEVEDLDDAVELALGPVFSCARTKKGKVECWGNGEYAALGDGLQSRRATPEPVEQLADVVQISSGRGHTCARVREGKLWCWGSNGVAQLGDGTMTDRYFAWPVIR